MNELEQTLKIKPQKFYEIKLPFNKIKEDYQKVILDQVAPLIDKLEGENLINGFHYIMHQNLDLRFSVESDTKLSRIKEILQEHSISSELNGWTMENNPTELYGGKIGVHLCYEVLEFYSRVIIKMLKYRRIVESELEGEEKNKSISGLDRLTGQFVHYLLIQQGVNNIEQIVFSLYDAIAWIDVIAQASIVPRLSILNETEQGEIKQLLSGAKNDIMSGWKKFESALSFKSSQNR